MAVSWMKKGAEAQKEIEKADQEQALKQQQNRKMWRFWLEKGEEAPVTFVDGNLTPEGILDIITYREHQIFMAGSWNNFFVCTEGVEPCPICEGGDSPSLVGVLTVIDHRQTKSKDGTKTYTNQRRLFVAKKDTVKMLQNIAAKRGGLAGARFDIMRQGDRSAAVGSNFDFIEKSPIEELRKKYTQEIIAEDKSKKTVTLFEPADYEKEINFVPAAQLRELGFGTKMKTLGSEKAPTDDQGSTASTDYDKEL